MMRTCELVFWFQSAPGSPSLWGCSWSLLQNVFVFYGWQAMRHNLQNTSRLGQDIHGAWKTLLAQRDTQSLLVTGPMGYCQMKSNHCVACLLPTIYKSTVCISETPDTGRCSSPARHRPVIVTEYCERVLSTIQLWLCVLYPISNNHGSGQEALSRRQLPYFKQIAKCTVLFSSH